MDGTDSPITSISPLLRSSKSNDRAIKNCQVIGFILLMSVKMSKTNLN
jgi:hypothetical protein